VPLAGTGRARAAPAAPTAQAARAARAAGRGGPPRLTLPPPTGPHRIGTRWLHLVDRSRADPVLGPGHPRELMASVWYPSTQEARRYPVAPWLPDAPTRALLASAGFGADAALAPLTAGHLGAPMRRTRERLPVIVYSHGNDSHRSEATIMVQELVSHGYVVVTVDSTFDAYSEFPDGRLTVPSEEIGFTPWDHAHDVRFVLDSLDSLDGDRLDLRRVGMAGWSKGATATAILLSQDRRVRAGLAIDGPMQSQPPPPDVDRPLMIMTAENSRTLEPSVEDFWKYHVHGWRLNIEADGVAHGSYIDHQWLIPQLARITGMSDGERESWIGTLDPGRALKIQRAYPLAFFDRHLRGRRQRLLEGPVQAFPEVRFIP
jgi:hypothetical protein